MPNGSFAGTWPHPGDVPTTPFPFFYSLVLKAKQNRVEERCGLEEESGGGKWRHPSPPHSPSLGDPSLPLSCPPVASATLACMAILFQAPAGVIPSLGCPALHCRSGDPALVILALPPPSLCCSPFPWCDPLLQLSTFISSLLNVWFSACFGWEGNWHSRTPACPRV